MPPNVRTISGIHNPNLSTKRVGRVNSQMCNYKYMYRSISKWMTTSTVYNQWGQNRPDVLHLKSEQVQYTYEMKLQGTSKNKNIGSIGPHARAGYLPYPDLIYDLLCAKCQLLLLCIYQLVTLSMPPSATCSCSTDCRCREEFGHWFNPGFAFNPVSDFLRFSAGPLRNILCHLLPIKFNKLTLKF